MKNFKSHFILPAPPEDVYTAIVNPVSLEIWTGEEAIMSEEPGSEFSLWEGSIVGKNLEFIPNKKIVQQWYFDEASDNSIVTINLHTHKNGSTDVELLHTNIPDDDFLDIIDGWKTSYFGSLQEYFKEVG